MTEQDYAKPTHPSKLPPVPAISTSIQVERITFHQWHLFMKVGKALHDMLVDIFGDKYLIVIKDRYTNYNKCTASKILELLYKPCDFDDTLLIQCHIKQIETGIYIAV
eukprot:12202156-Ditylum_brightwellii.AAC.2